VTVVTRLQKRRSAVLPRRLLLCVVVVLALAAAACGNSDDDEPEAGGTSTTQGGTDTSGSDGEKVDITGVPGVTDDEIRFSAFGTNSENPLGTCVLDCFVSGVNAYFAYRNSEGGIYGRKLVVTDVLDDQLSKNQQRALEITSANDTFGAFSATQVASGWGDITEAGMPLYVWNIHPVESADEAVFGNAGALCTTCTSRFTPYIVKLAKAKKIGILGYGISENSKQAAGGARDSIELYADEIGNPEVAYFNDDIAFGMPNGIGPEVSEMKRAGVDMVYATIDLNGMKTIAQELQRQGMGDVTMYHPNTYDQDFVKEAGDLFEGDYVGVGFRPFEAAPSKGVDTFRKWMEETDAAINELAMVGWIAAATAYDGLKAAGPDFDRAKVIAASNEKLTAYTAGGLHPPIDFSRQHEPPTQDDPGTHGSDPDCFAAVQIHDGEFEVVGNKAKPWSCWPGDTRDWSEPTRMTFE
jgi:ABC-type branched-subunit amino acid transport system substrate-binding protein